MATQMSSGEFNRDTSGAKKAAERGPVYITDRPAAGAEGTRPGPPPRCDRHRLGPPP